jgi:recombinational DNA repair protein RecT
MTHEQDAVLLAPERDDVKKQDTALLVPERDDVKKRFVALCMKIHGMTEEAAVVEYERETMYYKQSLRESDKLRQCTQISLYSAFLEIAVLGVTLQPGAKSEAYLESRSRTCYLRLSPYGELNLRIRSGQIIRMSNPQVIYEGDIFQPRTNERGDMTVDYRPAIPRKSKTIVGCYVCIVLPNDGRDFKWLLEDDIERLKGYSMRQNNGSPASNYTKNNGQIDPGFLEAKTIKHAMRAYTKLRISDNVTVDDDDDEAATVPRQADTGPDAGETALPASNDGQRQATASNDERTQSVPTANGGIIINDLSDIPF